MCFKIPPLSSFSFFFSWLRSSRAAVAAVTTDTLRRCRFRSMSATRHLVVTAVFPSGMLREARAAPARNPTSEPSGLEAGVTIVHAARPTARLVPVPAPPRSSMGRRRQGGRAGVASRRGAAARAPTHVGDARARRPRTRRAPSLNWHAAPNTLSSRVLQGHAEHRSQGGDGASVQGESPTSAHPHAFTIQCTKIPSICICLHPKAHQAHSSPRLNSIPRPAANILSHNTEGCTRERERERKKGCVCSK